MSAYQANRVLATTQYKTVGHRPLRPDGADKVTGKARYGADTKLPGLLHARCLGSPHAHARILAIDTSRAEKLPGVKAVVTAADFADPGEDPRFSYTLDNVLARHKVLYRGQRLAAVAASNVHIAEEALALIKVEYQVLPAVLNAEQAMRPAAVVLHDDLPPPAAAVGEIPLDAPNVANRFEFALGDVHQGFEAAEVTVEKETATAAVHQGYIESHSGTALWHRDGRLTVWSSSQGHFSVRDFTARALGVPVSKVRAIPLEIGGGFGAKLRTYAEPIAAALAKKAGAPVKLTLTRTEVFEATGPASGTRIRIKLGARRDGRLTAATARMIYEAGAYPGSSVMGGARCIMTPYDIAHARIEGYDVVINAPKTAAYRAPGTPPAAFAMETALDELAQKLQMDPLELRLRNTAREGTRRIFGPLMPKVGFAETLAAARDHVHYQTPLEGPYRGRGVASGYWGNGSGPSCAMATVNADGTVNLMEGSPDIGGTRASVAQQFAEVLGLGVEAVHPQIGDTDSIGFTSNSAGSSVTFKTGWAAYTAAQEIKKQLVERAAQLWEIDAGQVEYVDGALRQKGAAQRTLTFREVAAQQSETGGPIVASVGVNPGGAGPALAVHIVDVEVDPETGKVKILRYTALQDVGKAIHPSYVEGQIQGGVAQGVGWALNEGPASILRAACKMPSFLDYRMPTAFDLPMIDTVIVEVANPGHPYGVRGVGEVPIVPPLAALSNAISRAIGKRINQLPMHPGRILEALSGG